MRKVPEKQKTRLKERFFETSHKQVMYPRYHSNCALEKGAPLQAPTSPMHSRGSHGRRLLIPAGGCSDLQLGRDRTVRQSAARLPPAPGSLGADGLVRLRHRFSYSLAMQFTRYRPVCQGQVSEPVFMESFPRPEPPRVTCIKRSRVKALAPQRFALLSTT